MRKLGSAEQEQLLAFADFLRSRQQPETVVMHQAPKILPAKEGETVVGAIKRLRESYAMLDAKEMLNDTSSLMSRHVLGGEAAETVIVELERMFERYYQRCRGAPEDT